MQRTTYRWTPARALHHVFPVAVFGLWWLAWISPPGQAVHSAILGAVPGYLLAPVGIMVLAVVVTWGTIAIFHRADTTGKPEWLARLKLQQPFVDPLRPSVGEATRVLFVNHGILALCTVGLALALWARGWSADMAMPAPWWIALQLIAMGLITEVLFWSGHYWLHTKWLYRNVHRVHHRFRAPTAWSAQFAHPFEYLVGNVLPLAAPLVIVAPDVQTMWLFTLLALLQTQLVHSGYQLPVAPWSVPHDLHHYRVTVNYGTLGILDRVFRTRLRHPEDPMPGRARRTGATSAASPTAGAPRKHREDRKASRRDRRRPEEPT